MSGIFFLFNSFYLGWNKSGLSIMAFLNSCKLLPVKSVKLSNHLRGVGWRVVSPFFNWFWFFQPFQASSPKSLASTLCVQNILFPHPSYMLFLFQCWIICTCYPKYYLAPESNHFLSSAFLWSAFTAICYGWEDDGIDNICLQWQFKVSLIVCTDLSVFL